jgi:hypothetical protein
MADRSKIILRLAALQIIYTTPHGVSKNIQYTRIQSTFPNTTKYIDNISKQVNHA